MSQINSLDISSVRVGANLEERIFEATNVSLFLYNAAIWNAHRIHYDEDFSKNVDRHPGIVIDGPLQGDWLSQAVTDWMGDQGQLLEFEYSNRKATFLGERLTSGGTVSEVDHQAGTVTLELFIKNEQGEVTSPGRAVIKL